MFEEIVKNQGIILTPESYSIEEERWKTKHEATYCHMAVVEAELELVKVEGFDWFRFNRNNLRDVWASNCSLRTKYLATLWWGHVFRQIFNDVYSPENLDKMKRISARLNGALLEAAQTKDYNDFCKKLFAIIASMQSGAFRIPYVGPAFFTKVIQFFFAAHPVQSKKDYLPVIADRWLMRALYCEMSDRGDIDARNDVFVLNKKNVFLRMDKKGCIADSYIKYIDYFNQRCKAIGVHPWDMEGLLFKNSAVRRHFLALVGNPKHVESADNTVVLRVYDKPGYNYGKTFQICNKRIAWPHNHNTDEVYVDYDGKWYEAMLGSYCGSKNTLRGKDTIKKLIQDNRWAPGREFQATFHCTEEGQHIYMITMPE